MGICESDRLKQRFYNKAILYATLIKTAGVKYCSGYNMSILGSKYAKSHQNYP
ncbi:hypothetical protein NIES21_24390 [Anabaenopsis circularis NIES-21]|uniref:Uncharacterized protein n=1 Tax=Anabaenopsis circularis NIES-21 TaxID=1085406 RepID=A0A1Z4GGJ7_9CYAN|nr:hypothetical protein NIES21_24390 [Anabaenopsis circularis NIES-21]